MSSPELFLPHSAPRERIPMASHVRGTVIVASMRGLRKRGLEEAYLRNLDPAFHETIASLTAATWFPIDLALAHYAACDALQLDRPTLEAMGHESGLLINETVLGALAKLSRESGMTPWFALANSGKLISRTWMGSSMCVWKLGPKEARIEWIQQPIMRFPYIRASFGAFAGAIVGIFARSLFVREIAPLREMNVNASSVSYRVSWV